MKVIKIGAVWCSGCQIMKPRWAEIEKENSWLKTTYLDYDQNTDEVKKYGAVEVLPVSIFLDEAGKEFLRLEGEISKAKILEIINDSKDK
ncbi:MAG: thioredoxin family protein [Candidatus Paceibacterota bacterium]